MTPDDDRRLVEIAWRLDRLRWVPQEVLAELVLRDGACMQVFTAGEPPQLLGVDTADRELAWLLCAACPVQDECLELELRLAGADTTGVWGALSEDDRRALYPYWLNRGQDPKGGERS